METDSACAFQRVTQGVPVTHIFHSLVTAIWNLMGEDSNVEITHIFRPSFVVLFKEVL